MKFDGKKIESLRMSKVRRLTMLGKLLDLYLFQGKEKQFGEAWAVALDVKFDGNFDNFLDRFSFDVGERDKRNIVDLDFNKFVDKLTGFSVASVKLSSVKKKRSLKTP